MAKLNPFQPNSPTNHGMFVGRLNELKRLESLLIQTKYGNPGNALITGERGIGKSSLLLYLKAIAEGAIPFPDENERMRFLVIDTDIEASTTQFGLLKKIELSLENAVGKSEKARKFFKDVWGVVRRVEAAGIKLRDSTDNTDLETAIERFSYSLAATCDRLCDGSAEAEEGVETPKFDGILVLIDEADNGSKDLLLGSFLKLLLERLQRRGCNKVMFCLAGLPNLRDLLANSHQSSLRLFEEVVLGRLSNSEVDGVVDMCLRRAEQVNQRETRIDSSAREMLQHLSEGYPHFIQQFGFSAFAFDTDYIIDGMDVYQGAFNSKGALDTIGDRYYRNDFYNRIQQDGYRDVLRIMSRNLDGWVTKAEIKEAYKGSASQLNNAIRALRDKHIILPKEGEPGVYRLQHKGFAYWIGLRTSDVSSVRELKNLFGVD